jgi:hypothetical protein
MSKSSRQQKIIKNYYEHKETIHANKLSEIVSDLWVTESEKGKAKLWSRAQMALMRLGIDATKVAKVVGNRDMEGLAKLVGQADAGSAPLQKEEDQQEPVGDVNKKRTPSMADGRTVSQMKAQRAAEGGYDSLEEPNLKRALREFRRKLKALIREDESTLGSRYLTYGKKSAISAITPPDQFPAPVWAKLVELKRLKPSGQGMYKIP